MVQIFLYVIRLSTSIYPVHCFYPSQMCCILFIFYLLMHHNGHNFAVILYPYPCAYFSIVHPFFDYDRFFTYHLPPFHQIKCINLSSCKYHILNSVSLSSWRCSHNPYQSYILLAYFHQFIVFTYVVILFSYRIIRFHVYTNCIIHNSIVFLSPILYPWPNTHQPIKHCLSYLFYYLLL
jgi:hypothetical protein